MAAFEIPTAMGFNSKVFRIAHAQQVNPFGDVGFIQTLNRSNPFWVAEYTTPPLTGSSYNDASVFLDSLEGSTNTFLAYDPRRIMPYAYASHPLGENPWGASPRIIAQDYANSTISLDTMTVGAVITKGDYISVQVGLIWYLFKAQQTVTVGGGGSVAGLIVKPRPAIIGLVANVIRYKKACIEMKMIGDYEEDDSVDTFPVFRFRAGQFTNRAVE